MDTSAVEGGASDVETLVDSLQKSEKTSVFWAKLQSFPWWPARFASKPEIEALEGIVKSKEPAKQVMVVFLGTAKTR
jgi:hypothetical protein